MKFAHRQLRVGIDQADGRRRELHGKRIGANHVDVAQSSGAVVHGPGSCPGKRRSDVRQAQRPLRRSDAVDHVSPPMCAVARNAHVDLARTVDLHRFGNIAVRIDRRVCRVAGELYQNGARGEIGLHAIARLHKRVVAAVEPDDRGVGAFVDINVGKSVGIERVVDPAFMKTAPAVRVADVDQRGDGLSVKTAQGVVLAVVGKCSTVAELFGVEIHQRVAGSHEGVGVGDVLQKRKTARQIVVAVDERHALTAIGVPYFTAPRSVEGILTGATDAVPVVREAVAGKVVAQGEEQREVECIAVAAHGVVARIDPQRVGKIVANVVLHRALVAVQYFAEGIHRLDRAIVIQLVAGAEHGLIEQCERVGREMLGRIKPKTVHTDRLHHPLRVTHQQLLGGFKNRVPGERGIVVKIIAGNQKLTGGPDLRRIACRPSLGRDRIGRCPRREHSPDGQKRPGCRPGCCRDFRGRSADE